MWISRHGYLLPCLKASQLTKPRSLLVAEVCSMSDADGITPASATCSSREVIFNQSADGFIVERVCDLILVMLQPGDGCAGGFVTSAWRVDRPLAELTRQSFYSHE